MVAFSQPVACHGGTTLPWRSFLLGTAAIAVYLILGAAPEAWVFDRAAIAHGEWWRLITGHWVHSDLTHAAWDIAALLLLGALFEARLRWRLPLALVAASVGIDVWLWWGDPTLHYYCGLSGILNSLLIVGLLALWRDFRHPLILFTAVAQTAWPSVPAVHAVGFLCGLVVAGVGAGAIHISQKRSSKGK